MKAKKNNQTKLNMSYNTLRPSINLREYGRNIQNLVHYLKTIKTKEERTEKAKLVLKIMKSINPKVRFLAENSRKLWDDLYIISDYDLDIDSEHPAPDKSIFSKKISRLPYKNTPLKYKHYGRNIDILLKKASNESDVEKQKKLIFIAIRIMRGVNISFYNEKSELDNIIKDIKEITQHKINLDWENIKLTYLEGSKKNYKNNKYNNNSNSTNISN